MARYRGPKTKISRKFGEPLFGEDRSLEKKNYPPGQHGNTKRRAKKSEYAIQLMEKQKAKYTYGVLERQFRNIFESASRKSGVTGEILLQYLEARLDNTVYRLGIAPTRRAARQLVSHKHILVNGILTNIPSCRLKPGDVISVRNKSRHMDIFQNTIGAKSDVRKWSWLEWNPERMEGTFMEYPNRELIPENINEQLIVELYSK
jgi:small subunit ribosomal protein S4